MRQTYRNAKKILGEFGATLDDVVEGFLYVTDMDEAFAAAGPVRKEAYGSKRPEVASKILVTPRLALPTQLIEIKFIARVRSQRASQTEAEMASGARQLLRELVYSRGNGEDTRRGVPAGPIRGPLRNDDGSLEYGH